MFRYDPVQVPFDVPLDDRPLSSETVLSELRLTTRAEHDRIEHLLRLTEPMPLERYAAILGGFDAFLRAWEPRIHAVLPERLQGWFRARRRGGLASADVQWLRSVAGVHLPDPDATAATALPLGSLAEALGSLYVIEGSALGGRVIAPHLKRTLGLDQGRGASYFHGFGGETGVMWNNFRVQAALEIGESARATVQACQSARRTFAALIEMFAPLAPPASDTEAPPAPEAMPPLISPALLMAFGGRDPAAGPTPPPDDGHIDLPVDDEPGEGDTVIDLPFDEPADGGAETQPLPL